MLPLHTNLIRVTLAFALIAFALLTGTSSLADTEAGDAVEIFRLAIEKVDALEYEEALPLLEKAFADQRLALNDRALVGLHMGIIRIAFGEVEKARQVFEDVIRLFPRIQPPHSASPQVLALLKEARESVGVVTETKAERSSLLIHDPPEAGIDSVPVFIEVDQERLSDVARLAVQFRQSGQREWQTATTHQVSLRRYEARLPGPDQGARGVEYYIEGFGVDGKAVAQLGSPATPLLYKRAEEIVVVEDEEKAPFYQRWPFWTATGVATALTTVSLFVALSGDGEQSKCEAGTGQGCLSIVVK